MRLVWMKSRSPLSILIRAVLNEDCSHFAFVFESAAKGLMFESNLLGTHPKFFATTLKSHTVVHEKILLLTTEQEDMIWDLVVEKYDGKPYDFLGAIYLGWAKLMNRFLKKPLPIKNKWGTPESYFCDEIYDVLNKVPGIPKIDVTSGMDSPHDVWLKLQEVKQ